MSRTLRIEYPGAVYHVQSEGNRGDAIYLDDEDRETFLRTFQEAARRSGWTVYAYALMANPTTFSSRPRARTWWTA